MTSIAFGVLAPAAIDVCPVLQLQPILEDMSARAVQHNFEQIMLWTRQLCQHLETLVVDGGSP